MSGPDDEQEYHSNGEWPAIGPEDVSRPEQSIAPLLEQADTCECGALRPAGWERCLNCEAVSRFEDVYGG